ncbi:MAG: hypothetical protein IJQ92_02650 [Bacilli bacterium]|nr:hypothetical protein [Bacilli bacterium]
MGRKKTQHYRKVIKQEVYYDKRGNMQKRITEKRVPDYRHRSNRGR